MTPGGFGRRNDPAAGSAAAGTWVRLVGMALFTVVVVFVMVNVHELGHTIVARLAGDPTASYHLYQRFPDGGFCIGCNVYDASRLTGTAAALMALGGVFATQAVVLVSLLTHRRLPVRARTYVAVVGVVFFLDLVVQLVQGGLRDVTDPPSGVDVADFVAVAGGGGVPGMWGVRAVVLAASALYVAALVHLVRHRRQ